MNIVNVGRKPPEERYDLCQNPQELKNLSTDETDAEIKYGLQLSPPEMPRRSS